MPARKFPFLPKKFPQLLNLAKNTCFVDKMTNELSIINKNSVIGFSMKPELIKT